MWISFAERPLKVDELRHALAIELASKDFNAGNLPSITTLVSCCQGLIIVEKEASNVRLIHFTLKEYFSAHPDIFSRPQSAMAEICLTYLNSEQVKALSVAPSPKPDPRFTLRRIRSYPSIPTLPDDKPFLEYCSLYWGVHAKRESSNHSRSLALQLLQEYDGHISAQPLLTIDWGLNLEWDVTVSPFSGLHCASFLGIADIVVALIDMGCCDPNGEDSRGFTPLAWAAWKGHVEVVKILLGREEVDPDKPDDDGRTPLSYAAKAGHEAVVKMLLERKEVDPDKPCDYGRTPLSNATLEGNVGVMQILLGREEVNPNNPNSSGRTPLSYAASPVGALPILGRREEVVKILLGREEVHPDMPDNQSRTPLLHAVTNKSEGVVKLLLGRKEVNPDKPDNDGRTPLSYAAWWMGSGKVVKILLQWEAVNPDKSDNHGRTPLSYAVEAGKEGVVKMLLEREEVNPQKPDNDSKTPLMWALWERRQDMKALLQPDKDTTHGAV